MGLTNDLTSGRTVQTTALFFVIEIHLLLFVA